MKVHAFLVLFILFSSGVLAESKKVIIKIEQMNCSLCVISINKALRSTDGVIKAKASLKKHQAEVIVPEGFNIDLLLESIAKTGYSGKLESVSNLE